MEDLWALGRQDLRLSDDEFWALTPRQFAKLYERHLEQRRHLELLIGYNTAAVVNTSFSSPDEQVQPARFMPSLFESAPEPTEEYAAADLGAAFRGIAQLRDAALAPKKRRTRKARP